VIFPRIEYCCSKDEERLPLRIQIWRAAVFFALRRKLKIAAMGSTASFD
jgi:hypothetical protein